MTSKLLKYCGKPLLVMALLSFVSPCIAIQFPMFDARTAAMGGVNIGQGVRNAAFYNPSLAALEAEEYDWYLMFPSIGEYIADPDDIKDGVSDIVSGSGNTAAIIADINGGVYQKYEYNVVQMAIPTPYLGGAAYIAEYKIQTEKVVTEAGLTSLEHRAIDVFETGVSVAQLQDVLWFENVLVGATIKLMLLESYGYQEPIASADFGLDKDELKRNSVLNFDFGISKEYGVWKGALVLKNLLTREYDFGNSDETYKFAPQFRTAIAYESRRAVFEVDLDLNASEGVGFASDTMYAGVGWEWKIFHAFSLRLGYQQNLAGNKNASFSGGLGFNLWGLLLDFSASVDQDGNGSYMQASWEF